MSYIKQRSLPTWYELSLDENRLVIRVYKEVLSPIDELPDDSPVFAGGPELGVPPFIRPTSDRWGYGGAITNLGEAHDWQILGLDLPVILKRAGSLPEWGKGYTVSLNLAFLTTYFIIFDGIAPSQDQQIFTLGGICAGKGPHGSSIDLVMGLPVNRWVKSLGSNVALSDVEETMYAAHCHMYRDREGYERNQFIARVVQPKWLNLACPGNACELHRDEYDPNPDRGWNMICHNLDNPLQQLTLFAGLAHIHTLIRQAGF